MRDWAFFFSAAPAGLVVYLHSHPHENDFVVLSFLYHCTLSCSCFLEFQDSLWFLSVNLFAFINAFFWFFLLFLVTADCRFEWFNVLDLWLVAFWLFVWASIWHRRKDFTSCQTWAAMVQMCLASLCFSRTLITNPFQKNVSLIKMSYPFRKVETCCCWW